MPVSIIQNMCITRHVNVLTSISRNFRAVQNQNDTTAVSCKEQELNMTKAISCGKHLQIGKLSSHIVFRRTFAKFAVISQLFA